MVPEMKGKNTRLENWVRQLFGDDRWTLGENTRVFPGPLLKVKEECASSTVTGEAAAGDSGGCAGE